MTRALLQQALDALSGLVLNPESHPLITALREALAAPEPEPVAEVYRARYGRRARNVGVDDVRKLNGVALPPLGTKLYAAPPAAPASQWMPIETAPTNGRPILLYWKHAGGMRGRFANDDRGTGWITDGDQVMPVNQSDCTHWMPIPAAPDHLRDVAEKVGPAAAPAPDGWVMVPREPTPEMRKAAADAWIDCDSKLILNKAAAAIRAAIAASPAAPVVRELQDDLIESVIRDVAELDYSSLPDMPEVMLVTANELRGILQANGITGGKL